MKVMVDELSTIIENGDTSSSATTEKSSNSNNADDCMSCDNLVSVDRAVPTKRPYHYRKKKPADMPRRPLSAYNYFFRDQREVYLAQYSISCSNETSEATETSVKKLKMDPSVHASGGKSTLFSDMGKAIGQQWRNLPSSRKQHYEEMASLDMKRYKIELETYRRTKQNLPRFSFSEPDSAGLSNTDVISTQAVQNAVKGAAVEAFGNAALEQITTVQENQRIAQLLNLVQHQKTNVPAFSATVSIPFSMSSASIYPSFSSVPSMIPSFSLGRTDCRFFRKVSHGRGNKYDPYSGTGVLMQPQADISAPTQNTPFSSLFYNPFESSVPSVMHQTNRVYSVGPLPGLNDVSMPPDVLSWIHHPPQFASQQDQEGADRARLLSLILFSQLRKDG